MACRQKRLIIPVPLKGAGGQEGNESQEQEVAVVANLPTLPVPDGCHESVRLDADQLRDQRVALLNYQTPL
ncbi:hypothetical protein CgunFtcFv8_017389 [Champsocephalus gunnari]|uniref:Uncharacterized protein n=1 Tax=Champsocephalus gunnari TaxID=52237 RepID=A0AAN8DV70_CHAGU|nr:hypothetical protein CgunFtcFv8_017389 [Champsocephalus gunnari]